MNLKEFLFFIWCLLVGICFVGFIYLLWPSSSSNQRNDERNDDTTYRTYKSLRHYHTLSTMIVQPEPLITPQTVDEMIERTFIFDREEIDQENFQLPPRTFRFIPPIRKREELGYLLEKENWTVGAEIGVLRGDFAKEILTRWPKCTKYVLVDAWREMENYHDLSNKNNDIQERNYQSTLKKLEPWSNKTEICRDFSVQCALRYYPDQQKKMEFDFVYIDARHDYKGVTEDLIYWWPLVREGGIMAGHDFVTQWEGPQQTGQNWTVNYDGTVDQSGRAVFGAVTDFFNNPKTSQNYRQIVITYKEAGWHTWIVRK